jgi:hypothetical protein
MVWAGTCQLRKQQKPKELHDASEEGQRIVHRHSERPYLANPTKLLAEESAHGSSRRSVCTIGEASRKSWKLEQTVC